MGRTSRHCWLVQGESPFLVQTLQLPSALAAAQGAFCDWWLLLCCSTHLVRHGSCPSKVSHRRLPFCSWGQRFTLRLRPWLGLTSILSWCTGLSSRAITGLVPGPSQSATSATWDSSLCDTGTNFLSWQCAFCTYASVYVECHPSEAVSFLINIVCIQETDHCHRGAGLAHLWWKVLSYLCPVTLHAMAHY